MHQSAKQHQFDINNNINHFFSFISILRQATVIIIISRMLVADVNKYTDYESDTYLRMPLTFNLWKIITFFNQADSNW